MFHVIFNYSYPLNILQLFRKFGRHVFFIKEAFQISIEQFFKMGPYRFNFCVTLREKSHQKGPILTISTTNTHPAHSDPVLYLTELVAFLFLHLSSKVIWPFQTFEICNFANVANQVRNSAFVKIGFLHFRPSCYKSNPCLSFSSSFLWRSSLIVLFWRNFTDISFTFWSFSPEKRIV